MHITIRYNKLAILTLVFLALTLHSNKVSAQSNSVNECAALSSNLKDCNYFICEMAHPKNPNLQITQTIKGFDEQNKCIHEQNMPTGEIIKCSYSEDARKFMVIKMNENKYKNSSNPEQEMLERKLMEDIFSNECEIINSQL